MDWDNQLPQNTGDEVEEGAPGWMTTFGDMMSLLLTFFILLFSMSNVETVKFKQLLQSIKSALGVQNVPEAGTREGLDMLDREAEIRENAVDELGGMVQKELMKIKSEVEDFILKNKLGGKVTVKVGDRGTIIIISDMVLFPEGEASFTPRAKPLLLKLSKILKQFPYQVRVEGHTDNVPIHNSRFPSNWELSTARASSIVRFFITNGIRPERLEAAGYAEYRPIADNRTREGRAKNRRVEIVYLREDVASKLKKRVLRNANPS